MEKILGIDLGTTNSVIAIVENGKAVVIQNKRGERLTPSVVGFDRNGEVLVGRAAKNQAVLNSEKTIMSIKREMGQDKLIEIENKQYTPQEISARILLKLKEDAEDFYGEGIKKAVITVPAYFNDNQRQATKEAGLIAGFDVLRIINEPTAAALAYGINQSKDQKVLIYDLGGGTFDVSILDIGDGVFEVKATSGNNKLGGDDFDQKLIDLVLKRFKKSEGMDLSLDAMALQKLKEEVEKIKIELSQSDLVELNIPFITATEQGAKHLNMEIRRSDFEDLIEELIEETIGLTEKTLHDSGLSHDDIDEVILVGGSTRIPYVQRQVKELLGQEITKGVNPDECVAIGAAIQASILNGDKLGMVLVDVTSLSLGIEIEGGIFVPVIERNATIPARSSKLFTTISDYQKSVEIHVYQGERIKCEDNISLGEFQLSGIRSAKKGDPRIEVHFIINADGILQVSARDLDTNINQEIIIKNPNKLSEERITKIIEEARYHNKKDLGNIDIEKVKQQFDGDFKKLKGYYNTHLKDLDPSLIKEVETLIKTASKGAGPKSREDYKVFIDQIEFLAGEIKATCGDEREEVEVS